MGILKYGHLGLQTNLAQRGGGGDVEKGREGGGGMGGVEKGGDGRGGVTNERPRSDHVI